MKDQSQDRALQRTLRQESITGTDIVPTVVRLAAMNMYLHGLGNGKSPIAQRDSLASDPGERFDVVLKRDKLNLDLFWLKDDSLEDVDSLPPPDEIAAEIVDNLQAALEAFQSVVDELVSTPANR